MKLAYLDFDFSGDAAGHGSFDAMASADPAHLPALQREILAVLAWAQEEFGPPGPLEEGGDWDWALDGVQEVSTPLQVEVDARGGRLLLQPGVPAAPRVTLSFTLSGREAFCDALRAQFALD